MHLCSSLIYTVAPCPLCLRFSFSFIQYFFILSLNYFLLALVRVMGTLLVCSPSCLSLHSFSRLSSLSSCSLLCSSSLPLIISSSFLLPSWFFLFFSQNTAAVRTEGGGGMEGRACACLRACVSTRRRPQPPPATVCVGSWCRVELCHARPRCRLPPTAATRRTR